MALQTLTEGNKYSTTELQRAVIDRLVQDSRVLEKLPFESLLGNSLTYNTITTDSGATFYGVGDTWQESTPELTQATVTLKILGGDADVDNFLLKTRSNKSDLKGTVLENKIKAVQYKFLDTFYYGDATTNALEFSGLHKLLSSTTYNTVLAGATTGTALSMAKVRAAIDLLPQYARDGVSAMFMSKAMRRAISTYLDSIGDKFPSIMTVWGRQAESFDGIPIFVDDHIVNTELPSSGAYSAKTGGSATSIFILSFGALNCCGVQGDSGVETIPLGDLETKDAQRWRIRWYTGLKLEDIRSCAKVDGILPASTVTA